MSQPLEDTDKMPFGKHSGIPMQDVPASYFHYLWTNGMSSLKPYGPTGTLRDDNQSRVADYIRRNLSALKEEHPDGVWA
jgi:uncharacterized protein (DUF3820 family)